MLWDTERLFQWVLTLSVSFVNNEDINIDMITRDHGPSSQQRGLSTDEETNLETRNCQP